MRKYANKFAKNANHAKKYVKKYAKKYIVAKNLPVKLEYANSLVVCGPGTRRAQPGNLPSCVRPGPASATVGRHGWHPSQNSEPKGLGPARAAGGFFKFRFRLGCHGPSSSGWPSTDDDSDSAARPGPGCHGGAPACPMRLSFGGMTTPAREGLPSCPKLNDQSQWWHWQRRPRRPRPRVR